MSTISVILDFLALFIPAMIAVVGSFKLYNKRQRDTKTNLREAFLAEMEGADYLNKWPETQRTVPAYNFLSTSVYESNTDGLGSLTQNEVSAIVQYYTFAKSVQDFLEIHKGIIVQKQGIWGQDIGKKKRKANLRLAIDRLELARLRAIVQIKREKDGISIPSEGTLISSLSERIESDEPLLRDYGIAVKTPQNSSEITAKGEEYFRGNVMLTGLNKENDVLGRDKSLYRRRLEGILNWIRTRLENAL